MNEDNESQPESDKILCNDKTSGKLCNNEMENQSKNEQNEAVSVETAYAESNGLSNPEPKKTFEEDKKQNLKIILNNDESLIKFIDGEEIVDKRNPFKKEENGVRKVKAPNKKLKFGRKPSNSKSNDFQKTIMPKNDEFVTKEDVLKESKYVKTYVKNPDEYLTYDKTVLEKFSLLKQKKNSIRRPSPPSNIPKVYNKEPVKTKVKSVVVPSRPALKFKVKTNIDSDESLYDSNEVTINVLKFDSRFKSAEFGSQDDIEDIAEMTSTDCDEKDTSKDEEANEKKTFTNTVTSNDFKEFLKRKGLTLVPNRLVSSESKQSVIKRFFHTKTTNNNSG